MADALGKNILQHARYTPKLKMQALRTAMYYNFLERDLAKFLDWKKENLSVPALLVRDLLNIFPAHRISRLNSTGWAWQYPGFSITPQPCSSTSKPATYHPPPENGLMQEQVILPVRKPQYFTPPVYLADCRRKQCSTDNCVYLSAANSET